MMRIASYRIHQSMVEKPLNIDDYWPIEGLEKAPEIKPAIANKEIINQIRKAHNYNG